MNVYIGGPVEYSDMQGPAPSGFHVPLYSEWQAIIDAGVSLGAWSSSNGTNFSTYLKMSMAGYRDYSDLSFYGQTSYGHYWSSTPYNARNAYSLFFVSSSIYQDYNSRSYGYSVRCLQNSPTIPTASWTTLYQGSGSAGIFHNPTDGLISISSDGTTWYTLMDKNLGATTVYNYGDALTEANCGEIYQRGNNYGFSGDVNYDVSQISQSSTQINVTGYGPGNYYESSTWITTNPRQSSANDGNNLRGGVSQGSGTKSQELKNAYIGEYNRIPSAYQEVEYIKDTGTQWIDSNVQLGTNDFEISGEFMMDEVISYQQQIVSIWISSYNYWNLFIRNYNSTRNLDLYLGGHNQISSITTSQKYTFNVKRSSNSWTWGFGNNTSTVSYSPGSVNNTTVKLFRLGGGDYGSDTYSKIRMYSCKIYVAGTLVRDFIPCYRKQDNVIGMYDIINDQFYTNSGSGTFTKGPDV